MAERIEIAESRRWVIKVGSALLTNDGRGLDEQVIANLVEYPAVAKGNARLRLQMMPAHSPENVRSLASRLRTAIDHAQVEYVRYRAAITTDVVCPDLAVA